MVKNDNADKVIPKILGSSPKGSGKSKIMRDMVVPPPNIIELIAAMEERLFKYKAPNTGMNSPETMKAYEYSINSRTFDIFAASNKANAPSISVIICDNRILLILRLFVLTSFIYMSVNTFPEDAIRQLSAVDMMAEK